MATSRIHVTKLPPGFVTVRILQLLIAATILALTVYDVVLTGGISSFIVLVTDCVTLILLIWVTIATYWAPKAYNYWAVLTFEILQFILWIDAVGWAATAAGFNDSYNDECYRQYNSATSTYQEICPDYDVVEPRVLIAIAALSGALLILFFVSLVVVSVFIGRHRDAGGRNNIEAGMKAEEDRAALAAAAARAPPMATMAGPRPMTEYELWQQNAALQRQIDELRMQTIALQAQRLPSPIQQQQYQPYHPQISRQQPEPGSVSPQTPIAPTLPPLRTAPDVPRQDDPDVINFARQMHVEV